jgi:hypothetical protein
VFSSALAHESTDGCIISFISEDTFTKNSVIFENSARRSVKVATAFLRMGNMLSRVAFCIDTFVISASVSVTCFWDSTRLFDALS